MLVMMIMVVRLGCVKLVRANSYRMLVLVVQQKASGYRGQILCVPIQGIRPVKVHMGG